jgi:hypothetical protein
LQRSESDWEKSQPQGRHHGLSAGTQVRTDVRCRQQGYVLTTLVCCK